MQQGFYVYRSEYNEYLYKLRHLVENCFLALKRWRGIATRYARRFVVSPFGLPFAPNSCRHYLVWIYYLLRTIQAQDRWTFGPAYFYLCRFG